MVEIMVPCSRLPPGPGRRPRAWPPGVFPRRHGCRARRPESAGRRAGDAACTRIRRRSGRRRAWSAPRCTGAVRPALREVRDAGRVHIAAGHQVGVLASAARPAAWVLAMPPVPTMPKRIRVLVVVIGTRVVRPPRGGRLHSHCMDDPVRLAIVGCGGMGRRHLAGLAELSHTPHMNLDLVAVCDPNQQNANDLADEAHELLANARPCTPMPRRWCARSTASKPRTVRPTPARTTSRDAGARARPAHAVREAAGADYPRLQRIIAAAARSGRILSVAENFRRDPMNRLVRALLDDGAIGSRGSSSMRRSAAATASSLPVAPYENDRHDLARRRRPQRRHPAVLLRRRV